MAVAGPKREMDRGRETGEGERRRGEGITGSRTWTRARYCCPAASHLVHISFSSPLCGADVT